MTPTAIPSIPTRPGTPEAPGPAARAAALAATVAFTLVLAATLVSSFVQASPSSRPLPAPRPVAALTDFPDQARPDRACVAILTISGAVDNPRAQRANDITGPMLADACRA
jgi:hypothetical protein